MKEDYSKWVRMYEDLTELDSFLVALKGMPEGYKSQRSRSLSNYSDGTSILQRAPRPPRTAYHEDDSYLSPRIRSWWIKKDLVVDKVIKVIEKPKYNVNPGDFEHGMRTHWADDDLIFMSGRVAVLCPKFKDKAEQGLCYKHWVKNNIDPNNKVLSAAIWDYDEPIYARALFLLTLTITDGALSGYSSAADFFEYTTVKGGAFHQILRKIYLNTPTIHDYRRHLAESVKEKYTLQSTSQLLGHKSTSITAKSYVASLCGGYKQFYKQGLPHKLPIQKELELKLDALLVKIRAEINNAGTAGDHEHLNTEYRAQRKRIYARELERFRKEWA
ncbi:hypothetical protein GB937_009073 [Aspergillus fischeri]|nr:hypothetical protein GB937_009073 [Aspergillus fischeri]